MSGNQAVHPAHETLVAFGSGKLQPAEAVAVETHIAECEECCETLHDLGNDTFVDLVRRSDAVQLDSVTDGTIELNEAENETICNLPDELAQHPRYRVLELLGKGGMGDVYKAEHTLMNRSVALKVINHELVQNAQAVARFRREVQSAAQLAHPNIVTAYDAEQAGDVHFLVMEYMPGDDLSDVVKRDGPLDVAQACDYIRQAANGLQHAHAKGMVHRDVKPHNLMVTPEGQVKILDFGLAALAAEPFKKDAVDHAVQPNGRPSPNLTSAGSMMGTPDFVSPEQARDARTADIRSDIYSLGCTFYYLLTGRPPFTEGSAIERVKAHGEREPEPIENLSGDVPPELAENVRRMMAKQPAERFQTPGEVAEALTPFIDAHRTMPAAKNVADPGKLSVASRRSWWPPTIVQTLACAAFAFVLAGVIYVATDNGTLAVESDDESVEIVIRPANGDAKKGQGSHSEVRIVDTVTGSIVKRLRSGEYALDLKGDKNDFELSQDQFILKRGGKVLVQVTRKKRDDSRANESDDPLVVRQVWRDALDVLGGVSPDGRYLSFVDWDTGDLAVRDLLHKTNRRITNKGTWDESDEFAEFSRFSPDGKQLAYAWLNKKRSYELRTIDLDGGNPRVIYANDNTSYIQPMDWSPDGTQILAVQTGKDNTNQIVLISVEQKMAAPLKTLDWGYPRAMNFSPDGQYIVYDLPQRDETLKHDVFVIATDGTSETPLIEHPADDAVLGWSPDGKKILFASDRTAAWDAWLVDVADGKPQGPPELVKPDIGDVLPMGFRSDGAFFFGAAKRLGEICTASFDPVSGDVGPLTNVAQRAQGFNITPEWSRAGDLVYLSQQGGRRSNIIILSPSGQERQLSTPLRYVDLRPPAWSHDGRFLLVSGKDVRNRQGIYVIDVGSGNVREVVRGHAWGKWSPDGKSVYIYQPSDGRIYRRDLETNQEREVLQAIDPRSSKQNQVRFVVSPNGDQIAFTTFDNEKESWVLMVKPITGDDPVRLYDVPKGKSLRRLQWTFDGKDLVIGEFIDDERKFSIIPAKGGAPRELRLNVKGVKYLKLHPDGRQVALSIKQKGTSEVSVMENFLPPREKKLAQKNKIVETKEGIALRQVWPNAADVSGSISPDGRSLTFVDWETGDLAIRDLVNNTNRRLTEHEGTGKQEEYAAHSIFSPDATQIAYAWFNKDTFELRVTGIDGGSPRTIHRSSAGTKYIRPMDWYGSSIVAVTSGKDATNRIVLVSAKDGTVTPLKSLEWRYPRSIMFSHDGRYLAYDLPPTGDGNNHDILVIATDGTSETPLIENAANDMLLGWAPDGKGILYASNRTGSWDIWLVHAVDGKPKGIPELIKSNIGSIAPIGLTSQGAFYFVDFPGTNDIYTADFDAGTGKVVGPLTSVTEQSFGSNVWPEWSPDGEHLAFVSQHGFLQHPNISIASVSTGLEKKLSSPLIYMTQGPRWSADGRFLFAYGRDSGKDVWGTYSIEVETGNMERVNDNSVDLRWYDGKTGFASYPKEGRVVKYDVNTGKQTDIVSVGVDSLPQASFAFAISPDGRQIAFTKYEQVQKSSIIVVRPVAGGDEVALYRFPAGWSIEQIEWTPGGQSLICAGHSENNDDKRDFLLVPVEGGPPKTLDLGVEGVQFVSIHPDGKRVALNVSQKKSMDVWVLENFLPPLQIGKARTSVDSSSSDDSISADAPVARP